MTKQIDIPMTIDELNFIVMSLRTQIAIEDDQLLDPIIDLEQQSIRHELTAIDWHEARKEVSYRIDQLIKSQIQLAKLEAIQRSLNTGDY